MHFRGVINCIICTTDREPHLHSSFFYIVQLKNETQAILVCFVFQGEEGEGKKSILDVDPEVQAMMEMTGKTLHSQGLREPEEDQEQ